MLTKRLGASDMDISRIGLGAWAIGGSWEWGYGHQDDQVSIKTIHQALEAGINWIDTAPVYGLGHSESVVGKAIKQSAYKPLVFTKCGLVWDDERNVNGVLNKASIFQEVEASLKRLDIETVDLYQIHWPNPAEMIEEAWSALAELKAQGKVRYIGVSNFSVEQLKTVQAIAPVTSLQPSYSLVDRSVEEEVLPFCQQEGLGVISYAPMGSGLLTGKMTRERLAQLPDDDWRKDNDKGVNFAEPKLTRNLALVEVLREIAQTHNCNIGEIAIAWVLANPAITAAIVGQRSPEQVQGVIRAADVVLTPQELAVIAQFLQENP